MSESEVDPPADLDLLDAYAISELLGVHVVTARKLQSSGEIPNGKIGRRRMSRRADVVHYVKRRLGDD